MADKRLEQLPTATTLGSSDLIHISQSGIDKRINSDVLVAQLNSGVAFNFQVKEESSTERTLSISDRTSYIRCLNAGITSIIVPPTSDVPWTLGDQVMVRRQGGKVNISGGSGVTINGGVTGLSLLSGGQDGILTYVGSNTWDLETGGTTEGINGTVTDYNPLTTYTEIDEWVREDGIVYRPDASLLPIGPEAFDASKWIIAQITGADDLPLDVDSVTTDVQSWVQATVDDNRVLTEDLLTKAGIPYTDIPYTSLASERFDAILTIIKNRTKAYSSVQEIRDEMSSGDLEAGDWVFLDSYSKGFFVIREFVSGDTDNIGTVLVSGGLTAHRYVVNGVVHPNFFSESYIDDGAIDATTSINRAITSGYKIIDSGDSVFKITGQVVVNRDDITLRNGNFDYLNTSGNSLICNGVKNIIIQDITFTGSTPGLISVRNDSSNITVDGCIFDSSETVSGRLAQCIWLFDCDNIKVLHCRFISCGYGIITQIGHSSNNVLIDGCYCADSFSDFVESNGANTRSSNWTVTNNFYTGSRDWPTVATERRFVGFTEVEHVVITNNIVEFVTGDSAIHLEDSYGETIITGNIFNNWLGTACIYNLQTDEDCIIANNIFRRTDSAIMPVAISTASNSYAHTVTISNNRFEDFINTDNFDVMEINFSGNFLISDNQAKNCGTFLSMVSVNNVVVDSNKLLDCTRGIMSNILNDGSPGPSSACQYASITNNSIIVTDTSMGIAASTNTAGTNGPKYWLVQGNHTNGDINLQNPSGAANGTLYNAVSGNFLRPGVTVNVANVGGTGITTMDSYGNHVST